MIVSIAQPAYLPWAGYFDRIRRSDLHIVLDQVEIGHRSFVNRNRIKGPTWLTVPVHDGGGRTPINHVKIDNSQSWTRKHWRTLKQTYARSTRHWSRYAPFWEAIYERRYERLIELLLPTLTQQRGWLGVYTEVVYGSKLAVGGRGTELMLNICKEVGADTYLSGPAGREYLDREAFADAGIEVAFDEYSSSESPPLAAVDALFRHGTMR